MTNLREGDRVRVIAKNTGGAKKGSIGIVTANLGRREDYPPDGSDAIFIAIEGGDPFAALFSSEVEPTA